MIKPKVGLLSLGCARNLVDSEVALGSLINDGYQYTPDIDQSDIAIINTCGFVDNAKKESIDAILELVQLKKKNKIKSLVIMGCLSQRHGAELSEEIPEADLILGTNSFDQLPELLRPIRNRVESSRVNVSPRPRFLLDQHSPRMSLTPKHTSYIKISEGCINACSYCAIPRMKGAHRSRSIDDILGEAKRLADHQPLREINLIGQDTAAFGFDREERFMLPELLDQLASSLPDVWIRPLYAHPAHVTDEWIGVYRKHHNICRYLDLPIEHSHPEMLKRMNRGVTREKMNEVIASFRKSIPNMVLRTAVIVGFPGESQEEFDDLLQYMQWAKFERAGAFTYSHEEGTRAYGMENQIEDTLKKERFDQLMQLQADITAEWNERRIGNRIKVLVEDVDDDESEKIYYGRSEADAPEVDGQVIIHTHRKLPVGDFVDVKISHAMEHDVIGEVID